MALACPRCGTQNPDTNRFCQSCGTPLVAPPATPATPVGPAAASPFTQAPPAYSAPPGVGYAAPPGPPPSYQSPYYAPPAGFAPPQIHRTPWFAIIAVVVVLVVVMAGVGTVLAVGLSRSSNSQTAGGNLGELSSPSPAGSPSPIPTPSIQQAATTASSTDGTVTVPLPAGWSVESTDADSVSLIDPDSTGGIEVSSGSVSPPTTTAQAKDEVDAGFKQQFPDTKPCAGSKTSAASIGGVTGISWQLCFTLTSGAQAVPFATYLFVATNSTGTVGYGVSIIAPAANIGPVVTECAPILKGIVWKLK